MREPIPRDVRALMRVLLHLYPEEFREQFGPAYVEVAEKRWERTGGRLRFAQFMMMDTLRALPRAWAWSIRSSGSRSPSLASGRTPRRASIVGAFHATYRDLRLGMLTSVKNPASTTAIVLLLALGLGAGTAVFSILSPMLLRMPPALEEPERLVLLKRHSAGEEVTGFGHLAFKEYRRLARSFSAIAARRGTPLLLSWGEETSRADGVLVTEGYFALLGVEMTEGRAFLPKEQAPGASPVAILSHALWTERFGGDPTIIGREIRLNGTPFTVVGVAASGFEGLEAWNQEEIWLPLVMEERMGAPFPVFNSDFFSTLSVVARLAPGVAIEDARQEMDVLAARIEQPLNSTGTKHRIIVTDRVTLPGFPLDGLVGWTLPIAGAAGLLLAIVVVNVAGILLVRSVPRRKEMAVRLALGASRPGLVRQALTEKLVLAVPAGIVGLLLARSVHVLIADRADVLQIPMDTHVIVFATALALACCGLAAVVPALDVSGRNVDRELRDEGSTPTLQRKSGAFVAAQIALSLTLLTAAGVLTRSFHMESGEDLGFETADLYMADLDLHLAGFTLDEAQSLHRRIKEEVVALPGVATVSIVGEPPVDRGIVGWTAKPVVPEGGGDPITVHRNPVDLNYFEVLGTGLVAGRGFRREDVAGGPRVAVVNEAMAERLRPGPVLGRILRFPDMTGPGEPLEVVGVTRNVRVASRGEANQPEVLFPIEQADAVRVVLLLRPRGDPEAVVAAVRAAVGRVVPEVPPPVLRSVRSRRDELLAGERLWAEITTLFGLLALVVMAAGLYGTVSFEVGRRHRVFSVHFSLGAGRRQVQRMVVRDALRTAAVGLVAGLLLSLVVTRFLGGILHEVTPTDPGVFLAATALVVVVVTATAWLSSGRISKLDPAAILRAY